MNPRRILALLAALTLAALAAGRVHPERVHRERVAGQQAPAPPEHQHQHSMDTPMPIDPEHHVEHGAVNSMAPGHHRAGPHMKMTAPRPQTPEDLARAEKLVSTLRGAVEKYKDHRVALADGYKPFLPQIQQREYHFTNYWHGFLEALTFDPTRPTSLLYKKTPDGYELAGAMYTMPRIATEDRLNERVPLSVASWHLHVNLCMPPRDLRARADWTKFGLQGSISTPEDCAEAGGRFMPSVFEWMVHAYPFETSPEKIWRH